MRHGVEIKPDERLLLIQEQLLKFTTLDFSGSLPISQKGDDIDAIIVGINTLAEELRPLNLKKK